MKRINFRLFPILVIFSILGIILGRYYYDTSRIVIISILVIGLVTVLKLIFRSNYKTSFILWSMILTVAFSVYSGISVYNANNLSYQTTDANLNVRISYVSSDGEYVLGEVNGFDGYSKITFDSFITETLGYNLSEFNPGDLLTVTGDVSDVSWSKMGINTSYFVKGIKTNLHVKRIRSFDHDTVRLSERIRNRIIKVSSKYLDKDTANTAIAILIGDKYAMDYETKEAFSRSGLSHVLAVSGLHVGVLCYGLAALLKKFFIKKKYTITIIGAILLLYTLICNMSPSVLRASIMSIATIPTKLHHDEDTMNMLAISALIILLINPMSLFDLGFVLSFSSVLGLLLLNPIFLRTKLFRRLPSSLSSILSSTLSVNLLLLPVMVTYFNEFSTLSIFSNILVLPIMNLVYSAFFVISMVAAIIPWLEFIIVVGSLFVKYINLISSTIGSLGFGAITMSFGWMLTVPYYLCSFVCSDYFLGSLKSKKNYLRIIIALFVLLLGVEILY